ncbi:MAG: response regulator [gamma proteobacterium symbiont of Taylorina sp.]|nr:response regulator [gamma proteobacterium symbiont of Taylorina sp.]
MQKDILLVEDNQDDIDITMEVFDMLGIHQRVEIVRSGEEALKLLFDPQLSKTSHWSVILLDLNLPGINGTQVVEKLRHNPLTQTIPVVMLTSSNRDEDKQASYHEGVNSYVCKPVDFNQFVEIAKALKMYWTDINEAPYDHSGTIFK